MPPKKKRPVTRRHSDVHVDAPMRHFIDGVVKADMEISREEAHHAAEEFVREHGRKPEPNDMHWLLEFALKKKKTKN
ncbi:MAG: hypothetical protein QGI60_02525 [archaeon]|jgi:hypothetical protein|nr:hypothetical protein [archaeon]